MDKYRHQWTTRTGVFLTQSPFGAFISEQLSVLIKALLILIGGLTNVARLTQAYALKIPGDPFFRVHLDQFQRIVQQACQTLLEKLWEDQWIEALATSAKKAYKVIDEKIVRLTVDNQQVYLPSQIRRGIAERVGRILRSQAKRKDCYDDVLQVVQMTGVTGNLDDLVRQVALTLMMFHGKYYKWALIRQTLRTLRRYYYKLGLDPQAFTQMPYTKLVTPIIRSFVFPYTGDDGLIGQTIKVHWSGQLLIIDLKLPTSDQPGKVNDWAWHRFTLNIPRKIYHRIRQTGSTIHLPSLEMRTLKGGLTSPVLTFAWSVPITQEHLVRKERVMTSDLGLRNLTTSVVFEAGSQISRPIFWSPSPPLLHKIDQLYHHIARIQKKLDRYPDNWVGQGRRKHELECLYRKIKRCREALLHLATTHLVTTALHWGCQTLVLEDLRTYEPPHNKHQLSRKLSNWIRGSLYEMVVYKAKRVGINVKRVNPRGTSSYCPRCGMKGMKIIEPTHKTADKQGRFFYCPQCQYTADRDYIAAVNIYRMYQEHHKKRYNLLNAKPVSYSRGTGIPPNCSWRGLYSTSVG